MRWYKIEEYVPNPETYCFVRTGSGFLSVAKWVNDSDDNDSNPRSGKWMMRTFCDRVDCSSNVQIFGVTHFCIPSAVKIEE